MHRRVGRYWVLDALSSGGMATVHLGKLVGDPGFTRLVAIKRLRDHLADDPEQRAMFRDEARIVARVRHANVVGMIDVIEEAGELLLVMEYVNGPAVSWFAGTPPPIAIAVAWITDALEGLHAAHEARDEAGRSLHIVHRDISPQNIIVADDGVARVVDFGIAHAVDRLQQTVSGQVKGKPAYMAPEQAAGEALDRRVDVYTTAVVLWELLTGERLFLAESAAGSMLRHMQERPRPPSTKRCEIPAELDAVVLRGLAKRAHDRFATAREMATALAEAIEPASRSDVRAWVAEHGRAFFIERDALLARAERAQPDPSTEAALATPAVGTAPITHARPRRRLAAIAVALGVIATGSGAAYLALRDPALASPVAAPPPKGTRAVPIKIVVPAFVNATGEAELESALTTSTREICNDSSETVTALLRATTAAARKLQPEGPIDEATWIRAAATTGAPALALGSIRREAAGYRVSLRVVDPATGTRWLDRSILADRRDRTLSAAAELTLEMRTVLGDTSTPEEQARAADAFRLTTIVAVAAYARASEETQHGDWDAALHEATAAVAADPAFAMGHFALALAYGNAGRLEDAERSYRTALAHIDRLSQANRWMASGLYFMVRHDPVKAIEQLGQYVERYPLNFGGKLDLANAYFSAREMKLAEQQGRAAYAMSKAPVALADVALYAAYAGNFDEAERAAHEVIANGDASETAILALAHAELGLGKLDAARTAYAELTKRGATSASRAIMGSADLALAEARPRDAELLLRDGIAIDVKAGTLDLAHVKQAALAESLWAQHEVDAALAILDPLVAASHETAILVQAGRLYAAAHAGPRALRVAAELGRHIDAEARSYAALIEGEVLLETAQPRAALERFEAAQKLSDTWLARFESGRAYFALQLYPEAYQALDICTNRHGEALAIFLDDVPTLRYWTTAVEMVARIKRELAR